MNNLVEKYPREIERILNKYPPEEKRAAVMPLIYMAQREGGYVTPEEMGEIAEIVGISATDVASLIGFYTLFHDHEEGKVRIQVCNDLPCALRGSEEFLNSLCENWEFRSVRRLRMALFQLKLSCAWLPATMRRCSSCSGLRGSATMKTRQLKAPWSWLRTFEASPEKVVLNLQGQILY